MVTRRRFIGGLAVAGVAVTARGGIPSAFAVTTWLTARGSNARTGQATGEPAFTPATIAGLRRRWTVGPPTVIDTEALVRGARIYSVTQAGDFYAPGTLFVRRASDGGVVWSRNLPGRPTTPTIGTGRVVAYSEESDGTVTPDINAFDADSGAPLWAVVPPFATEAPLGGGLGIASGKIVVASGFTLSVLRASDGGVLRQLDVANGDFDSSGGAAPMIDGAGTAWYGYKFLDTLAVPPSTTDPISSPKHVGNRATSPVLAGNRVFIAGVTDLDVFNRTTGQKTTLTTWPTSTHHALAWDGTRLFASSRRSGNANALRAYSASGGLLWTRPGAVTAPLVVNGMVVVGEDTAGLAVYRATNGAELARFPGTARGADPIIANGQLLVGFSAGALPAGQNAPLSRFTF
jgi:outer membrane protein assembly factor BamB